VEVEVLKDSLLLALLLVCAYTDVRERRIYNVLTYPVMAAGVLMSIPEGGWFIVSSFGGLLMGAAVFLPFVWMGGMGLGDVKLLAAVGAVKGFPFVVSAAICTALVGGVMAVGLMLLRGETKKTLRRSGELVASFFGGRKRRRVADVPLAETVPYGVAIALGTICARFTRWPF